LTSTGVIRVRAWDDAVDGSMLTFDQYYDPVIFVSGSEADINYSGGDYGLGAFGLANSIASSSRKNVNLFPFGQVVLSPFYKVDLIDENLTYIQAGIMFLSKARTYDINLAYNWNISQIDRSVSKESIAGQKYIQPRDTRLQISGRFPALSETERTDTIVDITEMGTTKPFIYSVFPENNNIGLTTTVYGSFSDSNLTNNFTNRNEFNFTVVEDL
jgi:hypothetical protein